jgi:hypothetical protein
MSIYDLLLQTFCFIDDEIKGLQLRSRGPRPRLLDSEVLTIELVGEFLGLDQDRKLFWYFRQHHVAEFPALACVCRTTFVRQAANLWHLSLELQRRWAAQLLSEEHFWLLDSVPIPVCRLGRADRCRSFKGLARIGRESQRGGFFYGFRFHLRTCLLGIIAQFSLAPANVADLVMVDDLLPSGSGIALGDRNYWSPNYRESLAQRGWQLVAPFRRASQDPTPERTRELERLRQQVETSIGQLTERLHLKRVWARDLWHLCHRLLRKVLSHTLATWFCLQAGLSPLHFAALVEA